MKHKLQALFDSSNIKQTFLNTAYMLFLVALLCRLAVKFFTFYGYESWQISEFLINYQGGFVRRGLMGEILFFFVTHFNINIEWTVKIVSLICLVVVCIIFVRAFLKKGYSLYILPMCFFLGGIIISNNWIRKDYMFFCFLIPILWIYSKQNLSLIVKYVSINALAIFIILSHEVFVFFALPILFLLFFNQNKHKGVFQAITLSFVFLLPSILAFLSTVYFHGNNETAQTIWESWTTCFSYEPSQIGDAVEAIGWTSKNAFLYHFKLNFLYIDREIFSSVVWLITFPVVYYIVTNALLVFRKNEKVFTKEDKTILSSLLIFQLLCLTPVLIVLSCDYIRIVFYWITSSFAVFLLIPKDKIEALFPVFFVNFVERINKFLVNILRPSKTNLVFLMMFIGISGCYCMIESMYKSTMLYNILLILSEPFILLKKIILHLI